MANYHEPLLSDTGIIGINPAKVHAIWDEGFNNTILATHEFESRMPYIHRTCNNAVLDMYVNNLDKKLCTIDSIVAGMGVTNADKFMDFAKRGDGRVQKPVGHFQKLKEYYSKRSKAMAQAMAETKKKFWKQQAELDMEAMSKNAEHSQDEINRVNNNMDEEFNQNLDEACRQLGITHQFVAVPPDVYRAVITTTGWNNIDRYVMESVVSRTTLDYTDPNTEKKAVIKYNPVSITIAEYEKFDRLYVYLLPDKLSSFMRVSGSNGRFGEKLNELIQYKLFCVGYQGDDAYMYSPTAIYPQVYNNIYLVKTDDATITRMLSTESVGSNIPQQRDILKEVNFNAFDRKNEKRQKKLDDIRALHDRIERVIFPCGVTDCTSNDLHASNGLKLFNQNCSVCHSTGYNVVTGPGMAGVMDRVPSQEWFINFTRNAYAMKKSGDAYAMKVDREYAGNMSVFTFLSDQELKDIAHYLECVSRSSPADSVSAAP